MQFLPIYFQPKELKALEVGFHPLPGVLVKSTIKGTSRLIPWLYLLLRFVQEATYDKLISTLGARSAASPSSSAMLICKIFFTSLSYFPKSGRQHFIAKEIACNDPF